MNALLPSVLRYSVAKATKKKIVTKKGRLTPFGYTLLEDVDMNEPVVRMIFVLNIYDTFMFMSVVITCHSFFCNVHIPKHFKSRMTLHDQSHTHFEVS